jgi:hypothetical protein
MAYIGILTLLLSSYAAPVIQADFPTEYKTENVRGWTVHFEEQLCDKPKLYSEVRLLLSSKLREIDSRLPANVVSQLRKVEIYFHLNRPGNPGACYHPSEQWLKNNKLNTDWAESIEFGVAANFLGWIHEQPSMVLHEMSHAYHHQVLGYGNKQILNAYSNAITNNLYTEVLHVNGGMVPGYAATNVHEYFAECSEAYWGTNDMYPFVKSELIAHDPQMAELLAEVWRPRAKPSHTSLFNGKDFSGWTGWDDGSLHWTIADGVIVNDGGGEFLTTTSDYSDFDLALEYKTVAGADSGVYLRGVPQVQIWDTTEAGGKWSIGANLGSGGLWNNKKYSNAPTRLMDKPFGEWNHLRMRMVGSRVSVWLNKELIVDHVPLENYWDSSKPITTSGPIQLQTHGGEICWRNITLHEIDSSEANEILAAAGNLKFTSIFNGTDFTGWGGPTEQYEVVNKAIRCRAGSGGTIYTDNDYADFTTRFEFKLPAGGNNGLAIRYPRSGNTAYDGMCELQILDNSSEQYAGLKEYQYHGSAYGMVAAHRGFSRSVGEWNFQEVRVYGSKIQVELNGFIILDCDLAQIEEPVDGKPHPGRTRTTGAFGFAGHNDPVEFRQIKIYSASGS